MNSVRIIIVKSIPASFRIFNHKSLLKMLVGTLPDSEIKINSPNMFVLSKEFRDVRFLND